MTFPTDDDLRYVGAETHIARIRADLDAMLARTWRGRLAQRMIRWVTRARRS